MILHQQGLQQVTTASHPLEGGSTELGSGLQAGERGSSAKESFKLPLRWMSFSWVVKGQALSFVKARTPTPAHS